MRVTSTPPPSSFPLPNPSLPPPTYYTNTRLVFVVLYGLTHAHLIECGGNAPPLFTITFIVIVINVVITDVTIVTITTIDGDVFCYC